MKDKLANPNLALAANVSINLHVACNAFHYNWSIGSYLVSI